MNQRALPTIRVPTPPKYSVSDTLDCNYTNYAMLSRSCTLEHRHPWLSGQSTQLIIGQFAGSIPAGCNVDSRATEAPSSIVFYVDLIFGIDNLSTECIFLCIPIVLVSFEARG